MRTFIRFGIGVASLSVLLASFVAAGCGSSSSSPPSGDGGGSPGPTGWKAVVGEGAFFGQTFDDVSWHGKRLASPMTTNIGPSLLSVACFGNLQGWASGEHGIVAHTSDGGQSWVWQNAGLGDTSLRAIRFVDTTHGVVAGDGGAMAATANAGTTWRAIPALTQKTLRGVAGAADARLLVLVGDAGTVIRTNDAGATWATVMSPDLAGKDLRGAAADPGAHTLYVVDTAGEIFVSTDKGASFHLDTTAPAPLESVTISDDGQLAMAVGAHGLLMTRAGSGTWATVPSGTDVDLHAALLAEGNAYIAGDRGTLLWSTNVKTFKSVPLDTTGALYGLEDL